MTVERCLGPAPPASPTAVAANPPKEMLAGKRKLAGQIGVYAFVIVPLLTLLTLAAPAVIGGLVTWSWWGAVTGFFWAGLVRVALLHHVTWPVNPICHMIGERPFASRDRSANFWPMAILSMGESWHNLHHADPTCARHGVKPGQIDVSARLIWIFERLGWVHDVRWPSPDRLARISVAR